MCFYFQGSRHTSSKKKNFYLQSLCTNVVMVIILTDHSVLQIEQILMIMMSLYQWHQRLLLSRSFLLRAATLNFCGGRRRSDLCRSISSAVFVFQATTLYQNCNHCQECIRGTSAIASRRIMSSRSGRCGRSQRLFRYREGGVSLTQKRFASDDKNYRRSKF